MLGPFKCPLLGLFFCARLHTKSRKLVRYRGKLLFPEIVLDSDAKKRKVQEKKEINGLLFHS